MTSAIFALLARCGNAHSRRVLPFSAFGHSVITAILLLAAMLLAMSHSGAAFAAEPPEEPVAIAFASRIVGDGQRFRLIVDFDRKVEIKTLVRDDPRRLMIDLGHTLFSLGAAKKPPSPLVKAFRYGTIAPGRARMILELAEPALIEQQSIVEIEGESRFRVIVDVVKADAQDFAAAVAASLAESAPTANSSGEVAYKGERPARADRDSKTLTVVIDPGHGGIDGGAVGRNGTVEKEITLTIARKLRDKLNETPGLQVELTREGDTFVSLQDRINLARRLHADLLISIHADSLRQRRIRGATVYALSEEGVDDISRELADQNNRADLLAGLEIPDIEDQASDILIDMTRRETEAYSRQFAEKLVARLQKRIRMIKNPLRGGDFFVLRAPEIPSVLIELGYLSNATDEKLLSSTEWQELASEKMKAAIMDFLGPRMAAGAPLSETEGQFKP